MTQSQIVPLPAGRDIRPELDISIKKFDLL